MIPTRQRHLAILTAISLAVWTPVLLAQDATNIAPAVSDAPSTAVPSLSPDSQVTVGTSPAPVSATAPVTGAQAPLSDTVNDPTPVTQTATAARRGAAAPAQSASTASPATQYAQRRAEAQALGSVSPTAQPARRGSSYRESEDLSEAAPAPRKQAASSSRRPSNSSRPTTAKPSSPPPVVGGVYYPPSSPVYEANGYTWGYQPGRYTPGRYNPGPGYTPGRYTPGRYIPPGGAAAMVLESERKSSSNRSSSRKSEPSRDLRRDETSYDRTRYYGEFPSMPGNGSYAPSYNYYPAPRVIETRREYRYH